VDLAGIEFCLVDLLLRKVLQSVCFRTVHLHKIHGRIQFENCRGLVAIIRRTITADISVARHALRPENPSFTRTEVGTLLIPRSFPRVSFYPAEPLQLPFLSARPLLGSFREFDNGRSLGSFRESDDGRSLGSFSSLSSPEGNPVVCQNPMVPLICGLSMLLEN
jgi:hypothetical protein